MQNCREPPDSDSKLERVWGTYCSRMRYNHEILYWVDLLSGTIVAKGGLTDHQGPQSKELPRLARPKGCRAVCDIGSYVGQSRHTTGRAGWMGSSNWLRHRRDGTPGTPNFSAIITTTGQHDLLGQLRAGWSWWWMVYPGRSPATRTALLRDPSTGTAVECEGLGANVCAVGPAYARATCLDGENV